jgi:5-methylcytosine-specific restriction endonuclease McrA
MMPIDYKEYHPDWKNISRFIRQDRAQNKCEWCGAVNYLPHPITGSLVVLTVAHIDHNKRNNDYKNLAALCQRCHLNHDRKHHVFNRKYGRDTKRLNGRLF